MAVNAIHSDIRGEIYLEALRLENRGEKILKLNTGNPAAFGFDYPISIKNAIKNHISDFAPYSDSKGIPQVRECVLNYHINNGFIGVNEEDIYLTNGVSEGASMLVGALVDFGDEILLPSPCYGLWPNNILLCSGKPVFYKCDEENNWQPDINDIEEKISENTKAILIINPNNPTGAVYTKETLLQIANIAKRHNLIIISDEIYDRLLYDDSRFISIASICSKDTLCITLNGISKSHLACGIRGGWLILSGNGEKKEILKKKLYQIASLRLCPSTVSQYCIKASIEDGETPKSLTDTSGELYLRRKAALKAIDETKNISAVKNKGAFYVFMNFTKHKINNPEKLCLDLLVKKHILLIPPKGFFFEDCNHYRLVMLPSSEDLANALSSIDDFLNNECI